MDAHKTIISPASICEEYRLSKFYSILRYPIMYMKISSIYMPPECLNDIERCSNFINKQKKKNDYGLSSTELISINQDFTECKKQRTVGMETVQQEFGIHNHINTVSTEKQGKQKRVYKINQAWIEDTKDGKKEDRVTFKKGNRAMKENSVTFKKGNTKSCGCTSVTYRYYLRTFICFAVLATHTMDISRLIYISVRSSGNENILAYSLANLIFRFFLTFLLITCFYVNYQHLLPMCCLWLEYERKWGLHYDDVRYKRWMMLICSIKISTTIAVCLTIVTGVALSSNSSFIQMWPLELDVWSDKLMAAMLFGTLSFLGSCITFSPNFMRSAVMYVLNEELLELSKKVTEMFKNTSNSVQLEEDFDKFLEQMRFLFEIRDKSYDVVKHTIAASYVFTPILLCLVVYDLASGVMRWNQNALTMYTVVISLYMIGTTTSICGRLRSQSKAVWNAVYKVGWNNLSPNMLNKLSIFVQQISVDDLGYSFYGMMTVDFSSLLVVGGTILTYGIFVLQLKLDDRSPVACLSVNSTSGNLCD